VTGLNHLPKTSAEARAQGAKHYFTGKPCKHGHIGIRFTSSWMCCECNREWKEKFYATPSGKAYQKAKSNANFSRHSKINRENLTEVQAFYRDCPPGYQVDHIIPKHGANICGFDTLANLQYLPAKENILKSNKIDPLSLEAVVCVLPAYRSY
jgi:hypothetical protein